jgi:predicted DNA-binding transcriptional regulator AlpA
LFPFLEHFLNGRLWPDFHIYWHSTVSTSRLDRAGLSWVAGCFEKNKQRLSEKRKKRYAEDSEYRQRALERSKRRRRGESILPNPADAQISFVQAAERTGISVSTLHEWRSKNYFPDPKLHNGRLWFSEKQVLLLKELKEVIRVYGKRRGKVKRDRLNEVIASIKANWD